MRLVIDTDQITTVTSHAMYMLIPWTPAIIMMLVLGWMACAYHVLRDSLRKYIDERLIDVAQGVYASVHNRLPDEIAFQMRARRQTGLKQNQKKEKLDVHIG